MGVPYAWIVDFMAMRYGWPEPAIDALEDSLFQELYEVWRAWAVVMREQNPDTRSAPEPGPGMDLRTLAEQQGFPLPN